MPSPKVVMAGTGFAAVRQFLIEALPNAQFDQIEVATLRAKGHKADVMLPATCGPTVVAVVSKGNTRAGDRCLLMRHYRRASVAYGRLNRPRPSVAQLASPRRRAQ